MGEFCVGWNGWYGYSESAFDEFKISLDHRVGHFRPL
jgi:hypothetical protein